jgi:hypothetical protein
MRAYVLNFDKTPLTPCHPARARLLIKQGKAKIYRKCPFTIKLTYQIENPRFPKEMTVGIDPGSHYVGASVVDEDGNVLYLSQVELRQDIKKKMDQRRMYRRTRRGRKTRYRKARWLNRRNSIKTNRYSPTLRSKFDSHVREVNYICKILPVTKLRIETATFDPHAMKNPTVIKHPWMYQKGTLFKSQNVKQYVLQRDKYECKYCKGKSKDNKLQVHHIIPRSNGGSDNDTNLITLCSMCHKRLHDGKINITKTGHKSNLKHATQMNILINMFRNQWDFTETFGYITKVIRQAFKCPKYHCFDALAVTITNQTKIRFKQNIVYNKTHVSKGDYKQTRGIRSEQTLPTGKVEGFRKFDKVKYKDKVAFIKGKMSTGYATLMDIDKNKYDWKPIPKLKLLKKLAARSTTLVYYMKTIRECYPITAS